MRAFVVVCVLCAGVYADPLITPVSYSPPAPAASTSTSSKPRGVLRATAIASLVAGMVFSVAGATFLSLNGNCTNAGCSHLYDSNALGTAYAVFGGLGVAASIPLFVLGYSN
jgi:hypothetical protein